MADWLDEIEAQVDSTVPYYVPRLIAEIRRLRQAYQDAPPQQGGQCADDLAILLRHEGGE